VSSIQACFNSAEEAFEQQGIIMNERENAVTGVMDSRVVGIIIPTHNRLAFLREAISTVRQQTHEHLYVLVMDNASTDGTAEFLAGISDPRVHHFVNREDLGLARSITKGVGLLPSDIEWCTFLCDDDCLDAGFIAAMVKRTGESNARSVLYGHIHFTDREGKALREALPAPDEEDALAYLVARSEFSRETYLSGVTFSCKAFTELGGYPLFATGLAADDAIIFALAVRDRLVYCHDAVVRIRLHEGAESQQVLDVAMHFRAMRDFGAYCSSHAQGIPAASRTILEKRLDIYIRKTTSGFWLRNVWAIMRDNTPESELHLKQLYTSVLERGLRFSPRVWTGALWGLATGICLENKNGYRGFWDSIKG
jgi:glycosyltransferase involved in cell wall biosynthesis